MGKITYLLFLLSFSAQAFEVLELDKLDITYRYYTPGGRIPLINNNINNTEPANYLALGINLNILDNLRWDSIVHSYIDRDTATGASQFRTVSWEFSLYFSLFKWLDAGYYHHSQHVLDINNKLGFPVEDALFIRLNVYKGSNKREAIF